MAGAATSVLVGSSLAYVGGNLIPDDRLESVSAATLGIALLALARESGAKAIPLLQVPRQTSRQWAHRWGPTVTPALWGLDLGLTFTTWLNFSGVWLLAAVVFVIGEPTYGVAVFTLYWAGRALPLWIAPSLVATPAATENLLALIQQRRDWLRLSHAAGLAAATLVLSVVLATSSSI